MRLPAEEIKKCAVFAYKKLSACDLCPRRCQVDRMRGQTGFCGAANQMAIAHIGLHHGEEPPLSGTHGSGAVFFIHCNLHCCYCQNWQISHPKPTDKKIHYSPRTLAKAMVHLQKQGAHNINLVSPSHYVPQIIESLYYAKKAGLKIPIIYNTNGYDSVDTLKLLDGIIDIYLPDIKYSDDKIASKYSQAVNYSKFNRLAIKEMFRQVGPLKQDKQGIAKRGIIVRHLVLPNNVAGSSDCLQFIASISRDIHLSLMSQYMPIYRAKKHSQIDRPITSQEYDKVTGEAERLGLINGWFQELNSRRVFLPDFTKNLPF